MEIKGINGVISSYKATKTSASKKPTASSDVKNVNTDKVEFGFEAAIAGAKAAIAAEVKADATPKEILDAAKEAENFDAGALAALMLMG